MSHFKRNRFLTSTSLLFSRWAVSDSAIPSVSDEGRTWENVRANKSRSTQRSKRTINRTIASSAGLHGRGGAAVLPATQVWFSSGARLSRVGLGDPPKLLKRRRTLHHLSLWGLLGRDRLSLTVSRVINTLYQQWRKHSKPESTENKVT